MIDVEQYPYLADLDLPRLSSDVRVDILIGMDNADALMPLEVRCSDKRPGPAAVVQTRPGPGSQTELCGPGPARPAKSMTRPGSARHTIGIFDAQARPEPAGSGSGHWPDHIVIPQTQQYYYCVRILMSRDCLVVMFTITCIFNVCVKSSMDKRYI